MVTDTAPLSEPDIVLSSVSSMSSASPRTGGWSCETGFVSDLLVRCGRDDQGALALLFDLLSPVVASAASVSVEAQRVGDCVRDAFVEVWRDAPGYRPGQVSAVEWIMDRVATVSARLNRPGDMPAGLADAG